MNKHLQWEQQQQQKAASSSSVSNKNKHERFSSSPVQPKFQELTRLIFGAY
jgi:hypothetical protein